MERSPAHTEQPNYMFRTRGTIMRQAVGGWIILTGSTLLFACLAVVISQFHLSQDTTVAITFVLMIPVVVVAHYYLYYLEQKSVRMSQAKHTLDQYDASRAKLCSVRDHILSAQHDLVVLRRNEMKVRTQIVNVRRRAQFMGRHDIVEQMNTSETQIKEMKPEMDRISRELAQMLSEIDTLLRDSVPELSAARLGTMTQQVNVVASKKRQQAIIQQRLQKAAAVLGMA